MTDIATTDQPTVIQEIRSHAFQEQLAAALPPGITPERFARITVTALLDDQARQRDPSKQLLACDRLSLYQAVIKCAQDGLLPDGRQAALVKRGNKVVYQPMVAGLRAIAARYGWTLRANAVRENDEFDWMDEPQELRFKMAAENRGELVHAYAVARHKDGRQEQRVMTRDEVLKRMASATSKNVWESWPDEMWAKTAARDLFQELAFAPELAEKLREELELDPIDQLYGPQDVSAALPEGTTATAETGAPPAPDDEPGPEAAASEAPAVVEAEPIVPVDAPAHTPAPDTAAINAAAEAASSYVPPNGKFSANGANGPKTLAEILEGEKGADWFSWSLSKIDSPPEYRDAIRNYARVFAPVLYQEQIAKEELA